MIELPDFQSTITESKAEFLGWLGKRHELLTLVETGTAAANTAFFLKDKFQHILTIEADPVRVSEAAQRLRSHPHIRVVLGCSSIELSKLCSDAALVTPTLFFLDAHGSSDGELIAGTKWCPLLDELAAIMSREQGDVVVIDNVRMLTGRDGWPHAETVAKLLESKFTIVIHCDAMVAIPK